MSLVVVLCVSIILCNSYTLRPLRIYRNSPLISSSSKLVNEKPKVLNSQLYMTKDDDSDEPDEDEAFCCETDEDFVEEESESEIVNPTNTTVTEEDPKLRLIKLREDALIAQISQIESLVNFERTSLLRSKDKVSESGKNGFFIVQAQVNDFLVRTQLCECQY